MACIQDCVGRRSGPGSRTDLAEAAEKKQEDIEKKDERLKKQIEELNREIDEAAKAEVTQEKVEASEKANAEQSAEATKSDITVENDNTAEDDNAVKSDNAVEIQAAAEAAAPEIPLGNPKDLERLDAEEEKWGPEVLWNRFRKHYPKMQAFDSPGTAEILTICPQDIGLLPRENWGTATTVFSFTAIITTVI